MGILVTCLLMAIAVPIAGLAAVFLAEIVASMVAAAATRRPEDDLGLRPRLAVVIPAHNESSGILPTIADVRSQLQDGDRLLVVADNCSDDTAAVAAAAGADVVERNDALRIGKGFALDFALRHLRDDAPDVVVFVDADCRLDPDAIPMIARVCRAAHRPVQALYLMHAPAGAPIEMRVAEFAWRIKNWARPLGLRALGLPCHLMGTGMAVPWDVLSPVELASGMIVEDLKLGIDLARAGTSPIFWPFHTVRSCFPSSTEGAKTQRLRWEQGHIGIIMAAVPKLLAAGLVRADRNLLALGIDVAIPPLSMFGLLAAGITVLSGIAALAGLSSVPFLVSGGGLIVLAAAVALCWMKFGRDLIQARSVHEILYYVVNKFDIYRDIVSRKSTPWIRTDRTKV